MTESGQHSHAYVLMCVFVDSVFFVSFQFCPHTAHAHTHTHTLHTHTHCTRTHTHILHTHTHCTHTLHTYCTHTHTHTHTHCTHTAHTHTLHTHTHTHTYYTHTHTHTHTNAHTHTLHTHTHCTHTAHTQMHTHTHTHRKSGVNRLIRIMHRDGLYGFAEPLEFQSVVELIEYYRGHSLAPYSPKLDITLIKPVSKQQEGALVR